MISSLTRRRCSSPGLIVLLGITLTLAFAATLSAQVVSNPRIAEFDPSTDHWEVLASGQPTVSRYELAVYLLGASTPLATVDMGKPNPDVDGKIRYDFASRVAAWSLPNGTFESRVRVVGPEGVSPSAPSNPFTFATAPACTISLSATNSRVPATGGSYAVDVSTGTGCGWSATTALSWVTLWTTSGSGNGTVSFAVAANSSSSSRSGTITIGGQTLTLTQDGVTAPAPRTTPTVSWTTPAAITQGTPLGPAQLNATASVAGSFAYTPAAGTVLAAGTHTLTVIFTPSDTTRYTTATASTRLVVNAPRTTPTVSWPTPAAITQGTPLGSAQLNATASVAGSFAYTPAAGTVLAAGTHTLTVIFTPSDTTRYTTATASTTLVVNAPRTTPVISWPAPSPITVGTPLSSTQLRAGSSVPGTFVYSPGLGTLLPIGVHTLSLVFTPTDTLRYTTATASTSLVVMAAATTTGNTAPAPPSTNTPPSSQTRTTPAITWATPAPITQGTPLSGAQLRAGPSVPGTFVYTPGLGTVLPAGVHTLSLVFTPADTVNYATATASTRLVVMAAATTAANTTPAPPSTSTPPVSTTRTTPVVTWATPAPVTEGTPLSGAQLRAGASVPGTFVYAPSFGTLLPAGVHTLSLVFTPADTVGYTTVIASTTLVVTRTATTTSNTAPASTSPNTPAISPARTTPVVTWPVPAPIPEGTPLGSAQLRAGANVPGSFVYTPGLGTVLPAGVHTLSLVFTPADASLYTAATARVTLTVNSLAFRFTAVRPTGGTIRAPGITCGTGGSDCTEDLSAAGWLGLQAVPDPGYVFVNWTGDCSGTSATYALSVYGVRSCGAVFTAASGGR